jgi:hypothetical protein
VGIIPSIYLIALGLINGDVANADVTHFIVKIVAYAGEIVILTYIAFRLFST